MTEGASEIVAYNVEKNASAAERDGERLTAKEFTKPSIPWLRVGPKAIDAVREARKAATPSRDGDSAVETACVTPAIPAPMDDESDRDAALMRPSTPWLIEGERDSLAASVAKNAMMAASPGTRVIEVERARPESPWLTPGASEMDAESDWRKETIPDSEGERDADADSVIAARPCPSEGDRNKEAAFESPDRSWSTAGASEREAET